MASDYDFRHARATYWVEHSQILLGHRQVNLEALGSDALLERATRPV